MRWKIITIILALCAACAFGVVDHRPTEGKLKSDFLEYNQKYFYGALPTTTRIYLTEIPGDYMGFMVPAITSDEHLYKILVDKRYHSTMKDADITLLHESCHEYNFIQHIDEGGAGHGPAFQACMLRVAIMGGFSDLW
jgi:hypothetical protein